LGNFLSPRMIAENNPPESALRCVIDFMLRRAHPEQPDVQRYDQLFLKNALDWLKLLGDRDPPYLTDKVVGLISTAGGVQALQAVNAMEFVVRALCPPGNADCASMESIREARYPARQPVEQLHAPGKRSGALVLVNSRPSRQARGMRQERKPRLVGSVKAKLSPHRFATLTK
jgi:hypothetical protein